MSARNIKEFVNDGADELKVILAVKNWISRSTKSGKSDVYALFANRRSVTVCATL